MSNMNTLLASIRDGIANNAAIKVWTQANYAKDHKVFVGMDTRNPPGEADCPFVVMIPHHKMAGEDAEAIPHQFYFYLGIFDENTREISTTTTYKESILALITAELEREGKTAAEVAAAIALITDSFDEDPTATIDSNITEYAGVQNIEAFRQLVLAAIDGAITSRITEIETGYEPIEAFPMFLQDMLVTIEKETAFGSAFNE
ncbi:MAG: hypothetical protein ACYDHW_06980 [Syntrophorhabdaceae bacterium]